MTAVWPAPLDPVLDGKIVRLEPLERRHDAGLRAAAAHPEIWTWLGPCPAADDARWEAWMRDALRRDDQQAFATVAVADGTVLGSTRFLSLRPADRGLEIGWTWLTPAAWQTGANVEAKLLALDYAFTRLGCIRVELKTHASNAQSRGAMTAMGATFEGVHRKHRIVEGIGVRDSAWFSVLDDEWPVVRRGLEARLSARLEQRRAPGA